MPPLSHSSKIPLLNFLLIESTISIKGPDSIIVMASHLKHTLGPFSLMLCGYYSPLWFVWVLAHPLITDVCSHFSHSNSHVLVSIFLDQCFQSRTYESLWWIQQKKKRNTKISIEGFSHTFTLYFDMFLSYMCINSGIHESKYRLNIIYISWICRMSTYLLHSAFMKKIFL